MGRVARVDVGDEVYHVINRAVGRLKIFHFAKDYELFISLLAEAKEMTDMRILSFIVMPNHWHLQLYPRRDGDMAEFMHWLTNAHTRKVHALTSTIGTGPLYQARYKSFITQNDSHLLTVLKYIERNPVRAKLCKEVQSWRWGSGWIRQYGNEKAKKLLAESPVQLPRNYMQWVNTEDRSDDLEKIRISANKGTPFGRDAWVDTMVETYGLQTTMRERGRPKKDYATNL